MHTALWVHELLSKSHSVEFRDFIHSVTHLTTSIRGRVHSPVKGLSPPPSCLILWCKSLLESCRRLFFPLKLLSSSSSFNFFLWTLKICLFLFVVILVLFYFLFYKHGSAVLEVFMVQEILSVKFYSIWNGISSLPRLRGKYLHLREAKWPSCRHFGCHVSNLLNVPLFKPRQAL